MGFASYSVDADRKFRSALEKAGKAVDDLRPAFSLIAADFYRSQNAIFTLSGPGQYPPISEPYGTYKLKKYGFRYPLLVASGALSKAASIQQGPGNITIIKERSLTMGVDSNSIPYAIYHQSDRPRRKIPLRKFLFIGPEAPQFANSDQIGRLQRWTGILSGYVASVTESAGVGTRK